MTSPRARLIDAARAVLDREGLEGLTLRAIAREAGVSHGAPLRHFPTLASLLAALAAQGFEQLMTSVAEALDGVDEPLHRLVRSGHGYIRFALDQPGVYAVMFRPELVDTDDPAYVSAGAASFEQLAGLVADAQAAGWKPEVPRDHLAAVLWANVHGFSELWLHGALQAAVGTEALDAMIQLSTGLSIDD